MGLFSLYLMVLFRSINNLLRFITRLFMWLGSIYGDLAFIYGHFGYMFLCVSCLFPTFAGESPSPPQEGGSHCPFCNWFWSFRWRRWHENIIFVDFCSFLKPYAHSYKGKEPSMTKKIFILLGFFWGNRFQGKGLEFISSFVRVLIPVIYTFLVDYFVFI